MASSGNDRKRKATSGSSTLATELHDLITALTGKPLDLTILASAESVAAHSSGVSLDPPQEQAVEHVKQTELALFEQHIGPYEHVLGNSRRHALNILHDETFRSSTRGCDPETHNRYRHPLRWDWEGPRPDLCVWVGLFLGKDMQTEMRQRLNGEEDDVDVYGDIHNRLLRDQVSSLPILRLARNILSYIRNEADELKDSIQLLKFLAVYGLSGAMDDLLAGKYGPLGTVTIDTLLPAREADPEPSGFGDVGGLGNEALYMPVYAIGAVLGHINVVKHAIQALGAKIDVEYALKGEDGKMKGVPWLPNHVLLWVVHTNQPEMVKFLARECGFQFRWIAPEYLEQLYDILFHINRTSDEFGVWRYSRYNPDEHLDMREQRRYRAYCCYQEKQNMLKAVIEAGMPCDLFLPSIDVAADKKLEAEAQAKGDEYPDDETYRNFYMSRSREEQKARNQLSAASAEFNEFRKRGEGLTIFEFYEMVAAMWKDQATAQESRLSEYEKLDPRWKTHEEKGEAAFAPWWVGA